MSFYYIKDFGHGGFCKSFLVYDSAWDLGAGEASNICWWRYFRDSKWEEQPLQNICLSTDSEDGELWLIRLLMDPTTLFVGVTDLGKVASTRLTTQQAKTIHAWLGEWLRERGEH